MTEKYKLGDFINSINYGKEDLFKDPEAEIDYVPFIINKAFSFHFDTVHYANEMNRFSSLPKAWQFSFYLNSIPRKKRYSKWINKDKDPKAVSLVMEYYGYSSKKAEEAITILSKEQLTMIEEKLKKGGRNND